MALEIKYYAHKVGVNVHHLEWCTKYRYEMFKQDKYKKLCEEILRETAQRHKIIIRELFVMSEHIHMSVETVPSMSQSFTTPNEIRCRWNPLFHFIFFLKYLFKSFVSL